MTCNGRSRSPLRKYASSLQSSGHLWLIRCRYGIFRSFCSELKVQSRRRIRYAVRSRGAFDSPACGLAQTRRIVPCEVCFWLHLFAEGQCGISSLLRCGHIVRRSHCAEVTGMASSRSPWLEPGDEFVSERSKEVRRRTALRIRTCSQRGQLKKTGPSAGSWDWTGDLGCIDLGCIEESSHNHGEPHVNKSPNVVLYRWSLKRKEKKKKPLPRISHAKLIGAVPVRSLKITSITGSPSMPLASHFLKFNI